MPSHPTPSPWKMNRPELVETLETMGVTDKKEWTVPELRSILMEYREESAQSQLKGISSMKLNELIAKCQDEKIPVPQKPTTRLLMRLVRDNVLCTGDEEVTFGRYRYWVKNNLNKGSGSKGSGTKGYRDPESLAVTTPPPPELPPKSSTTQTTTGGKDTTQEESEFLEEDQDVPARGGRFGRAEGEGQGPRDSSGSDQGSAKG